VQILVIDDFVLAELSPDTAIVIESTDEERNRLLFLLASFAFFTPVALLSKASSLAQMRALIDAIDAGTLTGPGFAAGRLIGHAGCLDELVRSKTDLMLWRALVRFDKRGEVARASHVDERTVDRFTASKCAVVDRIETEFPDGVAAASPGDDLPDPPIAAPRRAAASRRVAYRLPRWLRRTVRQIAVRAHAARLGRGGGGLTPAGGAAQNAGTGPTGPVSGSTIRHGTLTG
jgi:hypothetical protein